MRTWAGLAGLALVAVAVTSAGSTQTGPKEYFVEPGGTGDGSAEAPFGSIQRALEAAGPGDRVVLRPGTYEESFESVRPGEPDRPITVAAADGRGSVTVTSVGRVAWVNHPWVRIEGLVLDGQYGPRDTVQASSNADHLTIADTEVRRSGRECVDMHSPDNVTIERSLIHHCLNSTNGRMDAHGIAAGGQGRLENLTIRDTEIHTFSGDAIQIDPNRDPLGWDNVVIEGCRLWLAPLEEPANGFPAGVVPGENAIDTKVTHRAEHARLIVRNTEAWGFRDGMLANMAAFNLKEKVDALVDGVTVWDSHLAFRVRGPNWRGGAWVTIQSSVIHDVDIAIRYEDNIRQLRVWNSTFGDDVGRVFQDVKSFETEPDVRNLLVLGRGLPSEAKKKLGNMSVRKDVFVDVASHDYHLRPGTKPIDAGVDIPEVGRDRDGLSRPQGGRYDVGAFEWTAAPVPVTATRPEVP